MRRPLDPLLSSAPGRCTLGGMQSRRTLEQALADASESLEALREDTDQMAALARFVDLATTALESGGRLISCGNGGSMTDAMHFAQEWTGRLLRERPPLPAMALSDPAQLTAIANDFGFEQVFARQVEAHGRAGDLLVVLSTSGDSENLVQAVDSARRLGVHSVGLLGRGGGKLGSRVDLAVVVPLATRPDRIQEVHAKLLHAVIEAVEERVFPEVSST